MKDKKTKFTSNLWVAIKKSNKVLMVLIISLAVFVIFLYTYSVNNNFHLIDTLYRMNLYKLFHLNWKVWTDVFDPFVTAITLLIALILGVYQVYKEWENRLEKRLTAVFVYQLNDRSNEEDKKFLESLGFSNGDTTCMMSVEESLLAHEGDIRNWSQQIGAQLAKETFLKFLPFFTISNVPEIIIKTELNNRFTKQYLMIMFLSSIPGEIRNKMACLVSKENYENSPNNRIELKKIKTIDYKTISNFSSIQDYIATMENLNSKSEIEEI